VDFQNCNCHIVAKVFMYTNLQLANVYIVDMTQLLIEIIFSKMVSSNSYSL